MFLPLFTCLIIVIDFIKKKVINVVACYSGNKVFMNFAVSRTYAIDLLEVIAYRILIKTVC